MSNWDDIRYFLELARRGSLSEAARQLGVEHSTVARRIAGLEEALGLTLFERLPRTYRLAADGKELLARAEAMEETVFALERTARGRRATVGGLVRISAPPMLSIEFIAPRLGPLRKAHPDLHLELIGEIANASLTRREADIALRLSRPAEASLIVRRVGTLHFGLYGHRDYINATPKAAWDYIGYDESLAHVPQQQWLLKLAAGRPLTFRSNDISILAAATRAGLGVAVLPHVVATDPNLVCLATDTVASRELWVVIHPDLKRAAPIRATVDHLADMMAALPEKPYSVA